MTQLQQKIERAMEAGASPEDVRALMHNEEQMQTANTTMGVTPLQQPNVPPTMSPQQGQIAPVGRNIPMQQEQPAAPDDFMPPMEEPKTKLQEFREQYPEYEDIADEELLYRLWEKNYSDMPREEFDAVMGYQPPAQVEPTTWRDRGRLVSQGTLVGYGEEATAALAAAITKVATLLPGEQAGEDSSFGDVYRDILDAERYEIEEYRQQHPKEALAYEVGGGLLTGFTAAGRVVGKTTLQKAGVAGAWGAAYGAGASDPDVDASVLENLKTRGKGAVVGAGIGAVGGAALVGTGKVVSKGYRAIKKSKIDNLSKTIAGREKLGTKLDNQIALHRSMGESVTDSYIKAVRDLGIDSATVLKLEAARGKPFSAYGMTQQQAMDKVATNGFVKKVGVQGGVMKAVDEFLEPVYNRIAKHSPRLAQQLRNYEAKVYTDVHDWHIKLQPFINRVRDMPKADRATLGKFLRNEDFDSAKKLLVASSKDDSIQVIKDFDDTVALLNSIGDRMEAVGAKFDRVENYFPSRIRDIEGLKTLLGKEYLQGFQLYEKGLKGTGGHREGTALNAYMRGVLRLRKKETALRSRKAKEVNDEMMKYYEDPVASLDLFLRDAAQHIRRRELFGAHVKENPKTGVELIDDSIDDMLDAFAGLDGPAKNEVAQLLKVRFGSGEKGMDDLFAKARAIAHNSLLGDAFAAATQIGDIGVSAWVNGFFPALKAIVGKNKITADDLGIMRELVSEISDPGSINRVTDWIFRNSGLKVLPSFRTVDRLGKNVAINSTLTKYQRLANPKNYAGRKKLVQELAPAWGDDATQLMDELGRGEITDLTKQFLFSKLSDMQPISRMEMPEKFLQMRNGRLFYQLGTWTMKQLSLFRNSAIKRMHSKDPREVAGGMKDMMRAIFYVGSANITADEVKRFMAGKDSGFEGGVTPGEFGAKLVANSFKNFTGLSEYSWQNFGDLTIPIASIGGRLAVRGKTAVESGDPTGEESQKFGKEVVKSLPLLGRFVHSWLLGGAEEFNEKEKDKRDRARKERYGF